MPASGRVGNKQDIAAGKHTATDAMAACHVAFDRHPSCARGRVVARPVHAADFFHGTLELVEPGVSVFLFKGEDALRPLGDRVERFVRRYTDKLWVLDAAEVALPGISARVRAMISPILLATLLERLSAHLEVLRDHPLTTRRYYKRVEY